MSSQSIFPHLASHLITCHLIVSSDDECPVTLQYDMISFGYLMNVLSRHILSSHLTSHLIASFHIIFISLRHLICLLDENCLVTPYPDISVSHFISHLIMCHLILSPVGHYKTGQEGIKGGRKFSWREPERQLKGPKGHMRQRGSQRPMGAPQAPWRASDAAQRAFRCSWEGPRGS